MSLEHEMKRIADALETIAGTAIGSSKGVDSTPPPATAAPTAQKSKVGTAGKTAKKSAKAAEGAEAAKGEAPTTKDDVMNVLRVVVKNKGAAEAKAVLAKFNADRISGVPEDQYQELYKQLKALDES